MPIAASSAPAMRAARRASAVAVASAAPGPEAPAPAEAFPEGPVPAVPLAPCRAPRAIAPGSRVAGLPMRATAPCSWSVESISGMPEPAAAAARWRAADSSAICCGPRVLWAQEK